MTLCDWELEKTIRDGELIIKPFDTSLINPNSIDLRLGDQFLTYLSDDTVVDPFDASTINKSLKETFYAKSIIVYPGDFILARTLEEIKLPDFYVARVEGKSSLARLGITIHQTGGWIDSGFGGTITLEISNVNKRPVKLYVGTPICQMAVFLTNPPHVPYDKRSSSKYNGQIAPTLSKYWGNTTYLPEEDNENNR